MNFRLSRVRPPAASLPASFSAAHTHALNLRPSPVWRGALIFNNNTNHRPPFTHRTGSGLLEKFECCCRYASTTSTTTEIWVYFDRFFIETFSVLFTRLFHFCPLGKHVFDHFPHFPLSFGGGAAITVRTMRFFFWLLLFLLYTRPSLSRTGRGNDVINLCFGSISDADFFSVRFVVYLLNCGFVFINSNLVQI